MQTNDPVVAKPENPDDNIEQETCACNERYKNKLKELAEKYGVTPETIEAITQEMNQFYWPG